MSVEAFKAELKTDLDFLIDELPVSILWTGNTFIGTSSELGVGGQLEDGGFMHLPELSIHLRLDDFEVLPKEGDIVFVSYLSVKDQKLAISKVTPDQAGTALILELKSPNI